MNNLSSLPPYFPSSMDLLPPLLTGFIFFGLTSLYLTIGYLYRTSSLLRTRLIRTMYGTCCWISYVLTITYMILCLDAGGYLYWGSVSQGAYGWIRTLQYILITPFLYSLLTSTSTSLLLPSLQLIVSSRSKTVSVPVAVPTDISIGSKSFDSYTLLLVIISSSSWLFFHIARNTIIVQTVLAKWIFFTLGCLCFSTGIIYIMLYILQLPPKRMQLSTVNSSFSSPSSSPVKSSSSSGSSGGSSSSNPMDTLPSSKEGSNTIEVYRCIEQCLGITIANHILRTWLVYVLWWLFHSNGLNITTNFQDTIALLIIDAVCINFLILITGGAINGLYYLQKLPLTNTLSNSRTETIQVHHPTYWSTIFLPWIKFSLFYTQISNVTPFLNQLNDILHTNNSNTSLPTDTENTVLPSSISSTVIPVYEPVDTVHDWSGKGPKNSKRNSMIMDSTVSVLPDTTPNQHLSMDSVLSALSAVQYVQYQIQQQQQQQQDKLVSSSSMERAKSPPTNVRSSSRRTTPLRGTSPPFLTSAPRFGNSSGNGSNSSTTAGKGSIAATTSRASSAEHRSDLKIVTSPKVNTVDSTVSPSLTLSVSPSRPLSLSKRSISHSRFVDAATSPLASPSTTGPAASTIKIGNTVRKVLSNDRIYVDPGQDENNTSGKTSLSLRTMTQDSNLNGHGGFPIDTISSSSININTTVPLPRNSFRTPISTTSIGGGSMHNKDNNYHPTGNTPVIQLPPGVNLDTILHQHTDSHSSVSTATNPNEALIQILGNLVLQLATVNPIVVSPSPSSTTTINALPNTFTSTTSVNPTPTIHTLSTINEQPTENTTVAPVSASTDDEAEEAEVKVNDNDETKKVDEDEEIIEDNNNDNAPGFTRSSLIPPSSSSKGVSNNHITDRLHATGTLTTQAKHAAAIAKAATVKAAMSKARTRLRHSLPVTQEKNVVNNTFDSPTITTPSAKPPVLVSSSVVPSSSSVKKYSNEFANVSSVVKKGSNTGSSSSSNNSSNNNSNRKSVLTSPTPKVINNRSNVTESVVSPPLVPIRIESKTVPTTNKGTKKIPVPQSSSSNNFSSNNNNSSSNHYDDDDDNDMYPGEDEDFSDMPMVPLTIISSVVNNHPPQQVQRSVSSSRSKDNNDYYNDDEYTKDTTTATTNTTTAASPPPPPVVTTTTRVVNTVIPRRTIAVRTVRPIYPHSE